MGLEMELGEEEEQDEEVTVWTAVISEVCKKLASGNRVIAKIAVVKTEEFKYLVDEGKAKVFIFPFTSEYRFCRCLWVSGRELEQT